MQQHRHRNQVEVMSATKDMQPASMLIGSWFGLGLGLGLRLRLALGSGLSLGLGLGLGLR